MQDTRFAPSRLRQTADIVVGADDFLFQRFDDAFEQLCGSTVPPDRQIGHWLTMIEGSYAWCAAKRARYVTLIMPERHVLYADKLPAKRAISDARPVKRLLAALDPAMRAAVLYPEPELRAARDHGDVFWKTDEHLNLHGNYVCYTALLDRLRPVLNLAPIPQHAMPVRRAHVSGSLGMRLDEEPTEDIDTWLAAEDGATRQIFRSRGGQARVEVFHNDDQTKPVAIVFGDSYVDALRHILTPHFSRTVIIYNCHRLFHDLVRRERPDVVVHVMSELRLGRPGAEGALSLPVVDFRQHCAEKLPSAGTLRVIEFGEGGDSADWVGEGWSDREHTHTWMVGSTSLLTLPQTLSRRLGNEDRVCRMSANLWPMMSSSPGRRSQRLTINYGCDGEWTTLGSFTIQQEGEIEVDLPQLRLVDGQSAVLRFDHPDAFALNDGGEGDRRVLSLAMRRLSFTLV